MLTAHDKDDCLECGEFITLDLVILRELNEVGWFNELLFECDLS